MNKYKLLLKLPASSGTLYAKKHRTKVPSPLLPVAKELTVALLILLGVVSGLLLLKMGLVEAWCTLEAAKAGKSIRLSVDQRQKIIFFTLADAVRKSVALARAEEHLARTYAEGAPAVDIQTVQWTCPAASLPALSTTSLPFFYALSTVGLPQNTGSFIRAVSGDLQLTVENGAEAKSSCSQGNAPSVPEFGLSAWGNSTQYFEFTICVAKVYCRNERLSTPTVLLLGQGETILFRVEVSGQESLELRRDSPAVWPFTNFTQKYNTTDGDFSTHAWLDTQTVDTFGLYSPVDFYVSATPSIFATLTGLIVVTLVAGTLFAWQCVIASQNLSAALEDTAGGISSLPFRKLHVSLRAARALCGLYRRPMLPGSGDALTVLRTLNAFFGEQRRSRLLLQELTEHLRALFNTKCQQKDLCGAFAALLELRDVLKALAAAGREEIWWHEGHQNVVETLRFEADVLALKFIAKLGAVHHQGKLLEEIAQHSPACTDQPLWCQAMYSYYMLKCRAVEGERRKLLDIEQRLSRFLHASLAPPPALEEHAELLRHYRAKLRLFDARDKLHRGNATAGCWGLTQCLRETVDPAQPFTRAYKERLFRVCATLAEAGIEDVVASVSRDAVTRLNAFYNLTLPRCFFVIFNASAHSLFDFYKAELLLRALAAVMTPRDEMLAANGASSRQFKVIGLSSEDMWATWWSQLAPIGGLQRYSRKIFGLLWTDLVHRATPGTKHYLMILGETPQELRDVLNAGDSKKCMASICFVSPALSCADRHYLAEASSPFFRDMVVEIDSTQEVDMDFYLQCLSALL